jgi:hypothetical protein
VELDVAAMVAGKSVHMRNEKKKNNVVELL